MDEKENEMGGAASPNHTPTPDIGCIKLPHEMSDSDISIKDPSIDGDRQEV